MKRLHLLAVCCICSFAVMAQDVIITRDEKRIESKIQEVSPTEIRYLEWGNQEGPVFVLPVEEIAVITFQNGSVKVFSNTPSNSSNKNAKHQASAYPKGTITRFGSLYVLEQDGDEKQMDKAIYLRFISKTCPAAYEEYRKGLKMMASGWGLLGGGVSLMLGAGVPLYVVGDNREEFDKDGGCDMMDAGIAMMTIGSAATAASVPLLCVGYKRMNNSHEVYNVHCGGNRALFSVNGQVSENGVGLALRF